MIYGKEEKTTNNAKNKLEKLSRNWGVIVFNVHQKKIGKHVGRNARMETTKLNLSVEK